MTIEVKDQKKWVKYSKSAMRLVLSIAAVYIILNKVDINQAGEYLGKAKWHFIILAILSFIISKIFAAIRINELYKSQELFLSEKLNLKLSFLAMFYNLFIPLVGGEGYKAYWINRKNNFPVKKLLWAALLDRLSGLVGLVLFSIIFLMICSFDFKYKYYVLLLLPAVYLGHYLFMELFFKSYLPAWLRTSFFSVFVQLLQAVTAYLVVLSLGVEETIFDYVFVFLLASFAFMLPMVGAREMAFIFGAEYLGLNMEISLAISLLFYLALAFSSLLGSYFLLKPKSLDRELETA